PAVQLLDKANVAALMAPSLARLRRVEGHAGQPGPGFAVHPDLIGANHPVRDFALLALIEELLIRGEILRKLGRRDLAVVAQIDLLERIAVAVFDVAGHVDAVKHVAHVVYAGDAFLGEEVAHSGPEHERLFPARAWLEARGGLGEAEVQAYRNKILAANHFG